MRRLTTLLLAGSLAVAALLLGSGPALAATTTQATANSAGLVTTLISGVDRYDTAIRVARAGFDTTVPAVVIASGDDYPDALCAGPLASAIGGPLLLTPTSGLTPSIVAELQALRPLKVYLVGLGSRLDTVGRQVAAELPNSTVTALSGSDRYQTAALVAEELTELLGTPEKVVIAPGDSFPDALAVAPLASHQGWPILYTPQYRGLPPVTRTALEDLDATRSWR